MTALRGGVLGVLAGTAAFIALEHATRLRAAPSALATLARPAAVATGASGPATLDAASATEPVSRIADSSIQSSPLPKASPEGPATRMDPPAPREGDPPSPTLVDAGRRAAQLADAMERLARRLERGGVAGADR